MQRNTSYRTSITALRRWNRRFVGYRMYGAHLGSGFLTVPPPLRAAPHIELTLPRCDTDFRMVKCIQVSLKQLDEVAFRAYI